MPEKQNCSGKIFQQFQGPENIQLKNYLGFENSSRAKAREDRNNFIIL